MPPDTVKSDLCDGSVESVSGYYNITGSKNAACKSSNEYMNERSTSPRGRFEPLTHTTPMPIKIKNRLLLVLRVPLRPGQRPRRRLAHRRARLLLHPRCVFVLVDDDRGGPAGLKSFG